MYKWLFVNEEVQILNSLMAKTPSMLTHFLATGKFKHVASDLKRNEKRLVDTGLF